MGLDSQSREMLSKLDKNYRTSLSRIRREWKDRNATASEAEIEERKLNSTARAILTGEAEKIDAAPVSRDMALAGSKVMVEMRKAFYPVIIRRTRNSKDFEGKPISGLPDPKIINVFAEFSEDEKEKFDEIVARVTKFM